MFGQQLKSPLFKSLQNSIEIGELSTSQRRGITNHIHKGSIINQYDIKKKRLETYYINKRGLQDIHKTIINENQSGFIKERNISYHIRLNDDGTRFADS